jgi:hypothetical protein
MTLESKRVKNQQAKIQKGTGSQGTESFGAHLVPDYA